MGANRLLPAGTTLGLYTTGSGMLPAPTFLDPLFEPLLGPNRLRAVQRAEGGEEK